MTPDQRKKALPTSNSVVFPDRPSTLQQWRIALQRVKILYMKGKWKECSCECQRLLRGTTGQRSPLHATYLNFYAALSLEASARTIHIISVARLQTLEQAMQYYEAASRALNSPGTRLEPQDASKQEEHQPLCHSSDSDECDDISSDGPDLSSSSYSSSTRSSIASDECLSNASIPKTLSLRIPQNVNSKERLSIAERSFHLDLSPCTPARDYGQGTTPMPKASHDYTSIWLYNRDIERYNARVSDFAFRLYQHLESIRTLISAAKEAQTARYTTRSISNYGDDEEEARAANLNDRIQRLKKQGWSRERFDSSRYERLCEVALAEL